MEGRVQVICADCGRKREVAGDIPEEYTACFTQIVREDGFVPRPGTATAFICGACLRKYVGPGTESTDDGPD